MPATATLFGVTAAPETRIKELPVEKAHERCDCTAGAPPSHLQLRGGTQVCKLHRSGSLCLL